MSCIRKNAEDQRRAGLESALADLLERVQRLEAAGLPPKLLSQEEAAMVIGVKPPTLAAWRHFGKGERPAPGRGEAAFWLPLLSLYSGARRSELAGLRANDVQEAEHVPCFTFIEDKKVGKKLKTSTAVRTVPVHPQLITLGLLRHVDAVRRRDGGTAWLFPEISPQAPGALKAWTKWFSRYLRSAGITDDSKVFHSFRHTFKDALRAAGVPEDLNDALAGQKHSSVGRSYGAKQKSGAKDIVRRFGMPRLKDAVYAVKYKGLKLSKVKRVQH